MRHQSMQEEPLKILLIEDNPAHAELIKRGLEDHEVPNTIYHVSDGALALDYLFHRGQYADPADSPRPHLVLLDIRLPRIDGLEVLRVIRSDDDLQRIPVIILTTSEAERDVVKAYDLRANSYVVKPLDFDKFMDLMENLGLYWLSWNYHL